MNFITVKETIRDLLSSADVRINGNRPWDIKVHNPDFYPSIFNGSSLALGESYMDQWWECDAVDQLVNKLWEARLDQKISYSKAFIWGAIQAKLFNLQNRSRAYQVGRHHYDLGNDLYKLMLDKRMNYSCGYWKNAETLDQAQEAKLDLICRKIQLKPGMSILDIGCGWGSFAKYAAEKYQAKVVGITISKEQLDFAKKNCHELDVEIRLEDYRNIEEKFERIVSIGMFEHVGYKNYKEYFRIVSNCLEDEGLFLLHTIGANQSTSHINPWINKYIFPNAVLPSASQITRAVEEIMALEDWHNFGPYYEKTLMEWHRNFNHNWSKMNNNYNERFKRMWNFYLLSCAGTFRAHQTHLWQIVFSKVGSQINYESIR